MAQPARSHVHSARDELVYALDHEDVVLRELDALRRMGVLTRKPEVTERNPVLDLGLVEVTFQPEVVAERNRVVDDAAGTDVDDILAMVRDHCRYHYRGWVPTIGKNRVLSGIGGVGGHLSGGGGHLSGGGGHLSGGSGSWPEPADPPRPPTGRAGEGRRIAVIDTSLYARPDLGPHVHLHGHRFRARSVMPYQSGHATFVTGLVREQVPGAQVEVYGLLDEYANTTSWDLAVALVDLVDAGVDIINLSLGCYTLDDQPPLVLQRAATILAARVAIVSAAGNHRQPFRPRPYWPAALDGVVAVGARGRRGLASFSPRAPWVDFTAPGVDVGSVYLEGSVHVEKGRKPFAGGAVWSGTSFAAATATGAVVAAAAKAGTPARDVVREWRKSPPTSGPVRRYRYPATDEVGDRT